MDREISPPPAKRRKTRATAFATSSSAAASSSSSEALPPLDKDAIRIVSWNINGIEPFLQKPITTYFQSPKRKASNTTKDPTHPASLRGFLERHKWPSILFLQEVKISSQDNQTQDAVRTAINKKLPSETTTSTSGPTYEAHFVLPTDRYNARGPHGNGKVYGVCSILRTDLHLTYTLTTRSVPWDHEGRISVIELRSPATKPLALYNIYAVNGTDNPWRDSQTGIVKGTRHLKKRMLQLSLAVECRTLVSEGWNIVLGGDMNVALEARDAYPKLRVHPAEHGGKVPGFKGVDVWREMHGEDRRYTYFPVGRKWGSSCDRVDYFVVGKGGNTGV
ncbi:DNase I-like protein [Plenodomus tracheiphilus IPT5]|uniref:DNase I-like protein n=1 Tax=Plenodomus tracheiphilus IPT5 TaxID=1408161 RepID=A0A6A7AZF1_9PLEO|nr:DNase I-like protein [Plenodomus tracheiphilus IPT5]